MKGAISNKAIDSTLKSSKAFCKFLSANDSGETGGHQSGILISISARNMLFTNKELNENHILKKDVRVKWQDNFYTDSCFTWYESKKELRITRFGRGFPLLRPEYTGALFVLTKNENGEFEGYILNTEDDILDYLDTFGLTPAETNRLVEINRVSFMLDEAQAIQSFINSLNEDFPSANEMSKAARDIQLLINGNDSLIRNNPDGILLDWTDEEYRLFRAIEDERYGALVRQGFSTVDQFVVLANQVLNRRKSRAGKSLENHLAALFDGNGIQYTAQGITEGNKRPDFIFPSIEDYHNTLFSVERLCTLAAKTTCKDRWRQVLNEADRLRDQKKYLCTMQQGISSAQMDEMEAEGVILVVPKRFISTFPREKQSRIWTVNRFISYVREIENM